MVVSGDEVARSKPDPEIYLRVLGRWPGARFFVVEDSAHGAAAAAAAGMEVILFGRDDGARWGRATTDLGDVVGFATEPDPVVDRVDARIVGERRLPAEDEARVVSLWDAARLADPRLFDGRVVCYRRHVLDGEGLHVELDLCPYRHVFARLHSLALPGRLTPVGVSGIAIDSVGNVLIARRARVTEYPGFLECVPSGGVAAPSGDRVDLVAQVATELAEEAAGLAWQRIDPLGIVTDELHGTFEVGFVVRCDRLPRDLGDTDEYVDYQVVPLVQLPGFLADRPTVPTTRKLVRLALRRLGPHAAP